nr:21 kDa protein-like [Ipomoea batatas]
MLPFHNIPWKFMLVLAWITPACHGGGGGGSYVRDACSVTIHQDLCIHSLAPFSNKAKNHPDRWARIGLSVTISQVKTISSSLSKLKRQGTLRGRSQMALWDCVECFEDALDSLHRSLGVLRKLNAKNFTTQMGDVTTWMSAALTNEDTCLDGFGRPKREKVRWLVNKVTNVSYLTSNALALVNKLATTGPE